MSNLYFQVSAFFVLILIIIIYYTKDRVNNIETKLYSSLIIITLFSLITDISIILFTYSSYPIVILEILNKFFFTFILLWLSSLSMYIIYITFENSKYINADRIKYIINSYLFYNFIFVIMLIFSKVFIVNDSGVMYSYGPGLNLLIKFSIMYIIIISICVIMNFFNFEEERNIKTYPIYALLLLIIINMVVNKVAPQILLTTPTMAYIILIMYFTIENPDLKIIEELNIARELAVKANNSKTDFLSSMSHEIRTPLNAVVGFSESLIEDENIPENAREDIKDIISASNSLLDIVNSILDISKIEANKLEITNKIYNPRELFNELIKLTETRLRDKPIKFEAHIDGTLPEYLYGDDVRLKQIVLNILTNATKYTKEGKIVLWVNVINDDIFSRMIISVHDTGVGIKREYLGKLFNKFERINEGNTSTEGTGLGLAITKKLVDLMNGRIVVSSVYGEGTKFTITIAQKISNLKKDVVVKEDLSSYDFSDKNVLIVDDNKLNLKVAERILSLYDIKPQTALSGFELIELVKEGFTYDLILLDDMMPEMTGTETLQKLKNEHNFNMKTVVLTANAIEGMREQYLNAGFDDYLAKPINRDELNRVLSKYLFK